MTHCNHCSDVVVAGWILIFIIQVNSAAIGSSKEMREVFIESQHRKKVHKILATEYKIQQSKYYNEQQPSDSHSS